jgi:MFS family permease
MLTVVIARDVLGKGEFEFGMLKAAIGLGSVGGALSVAYFSSRRGRGWRLEQFNVIFPLSLLATAGFALLGSYELVLLGLVAVGASFIPQLSLCNMLIQTSIPDAIRGRVMGVYTLIIFGSFPLGALIGGLMADRLGAPWTVAITALALLGIGLGVRFAAPEVGRLD